MIRKMEDWVAKLKGKSASSREVWCQTSTTDLTPNAFIHEPCHQQDNTSAASFSAAGVILGESTIWDCDNRGNSIKWGCHLSPCREKHFGFLRESLFSGESMNDFRVPSLFCFLFLYGSWIDTTKFSSN